MTQRELGDLEHHTHCEPRGGNIVVFGCFSAKVTGHLIKESMNRVGVMYGGISILENIEDESSSGIFQGSRVTKSVSGPSSSRKPVDRVESPLCSMCKNHHCS